MLTNSFLALGCALVVSLVLVPGSLGNRERLFPINGPKLVTKHDVASQLRHFLSNKFGSKERCERYALALAEFEKKDSLDYFKMAEIATMEKRRASAEYKKIVWLQLMNLYKTGVASFQTAHKVNDAMVELHGCLRADFGSREAKAIEFLNDKELQKSVDQWKSISKESAELLTGRKQHSTLKLEQLHGDVASSVAQWLAGGERDLPKLFASVHQQRQPQARAEAKATVGDSKEPKPVARAEVRAQAPHAPAPEPKFQPQPGPRNQPLSEPKLRREPQPDAHLQSPEPRGELPPENQLQWSEDEAMFLNEKIDTLSKTYDSMSLDTPLAVKCRTYNDLISQNDQPEGAKTEDKSDKVFVPSQSERANFLFMVRMVQSAPGTEGLFLDLAFCAEQWKTSDNEIRDYFNSAEYLEALENIRPPEEQVDLQSVNQPVAK